MDELHGRQYGPVEAVILAGADNKIPFFVPKNTSVAWKVEVKGLDIGFAVKLRIQELGGAVEMDLEPLQRINSSQPPITGGRRAAGFERHILLEFDNSFSKLRSKAVEYVVATGQKAEKLLGSSGQYDSADMPAIATAEDDSRGEYSSRSTCKEADLLNGCHGNYFMDWSKYFDDNTQCYYFYNERTCASQWDDPGQLLNCGDDLVDGERRGKDGRENAVERDAGIPQISFMPSHMLAAPSSSSFETNSTSIHSRTPSIQVSSAPDAYYSDMDGEEDDNDDNFRGRDGDENMSEISPEAGSDGNLDINMEYSDWRAQFLAEDSLECTSASETPYEDRFMASLERRKVRQSSSLVGGSKQDYIGLARIYKLQRPYSESTAQLTCVLCNQNDAIDCFFPCEHRCVCRDCIIKEHVVEVSKFNDMSAIGFCNCPLCATIIKKIIPADGSGGEIEAYWRWVHEVAPPIPAAFLRNFKYSAEVIGEVYAQDGTGELIAQRRRFNQGKGLVRGSHSSKQLKGQIGANAAYDSDSGGRDEPEQCALS